MTVEVRVTQAKQYRALDSKVQDFNQNVYTYDKARVSQQLRIAQKGGEKDTECR